MQTISYGRIIIEEGYRDGTVVNRVERTEESIPIVTKREALDTIFAQLDKLKLDSCVEFKVYADKHTHEITRIVTISNRHLN